MEKRLKRHRMNRRSTKPVLTGAWWMLWLLLFLSPAFGATVDKTLDLDRVGVNMSMAAEGNGDLHLVWRAGTGNNPQGYCEIRYLHYTAADDSWHFPSLLLGEGCGTLVSSNVDVNQPKIAADPTTPGRAYVTFAGDFTVSTRPVLVQIDAATNLQGVVTRSINLGTLGREIKDVAIAVGLDGLVYAAHTFIDVSRGNNQIKVYRAASGSSSFGQAEKASGPPIGNGLAIAVSDDGMAQVVGTFGINRNDGVYSRREGLTAGAWTPGSQTFDIPSSPGKVRLQPWPGSTRLDLYGITALDGLLGRDLYFSELTTARASVSPTILHRYGFDNVSDKFATQEINVAASAGGRRAVAYGIDSTFDDSLQLTDVGIVLTVPAGTEWPTQFEDGQDFDGLCVCGEPGCATTPPNCTPLLDSCDLYCDGLNDLIAGEKSLERVKTEGVPFPYIGVGTDGREAIVFDDAEGLGIAFSGENLWVAYYDATVQKARVSRITFGPVVPGLSWPVLALALALLGGLLVFGKSGASPVRAG